jgi:SAM-dependent methyltransferase
MTALASRSSKLHTIGRRLGLRQAAEEAGDWVRYQLDSRSDPVYQPNGRLPAAGRRASRSEGSQSRWDAMLPILDELRPESAVDIGCNAGWFTVRLASRGIAALGIESHPPYLRTALYAARRSGLPNVGIASLLVTPETIALVPRADVTLVLAVWHHILETEGRRRADTILSELWARSARALFFETACDREAPGLPAMGGDPRAWVEHHLARACPGGRVEHLGRHAGAGEALRDLFVVLR